MLVTLIKMFTFALTLNTVVGTGHDVKQGDVPIVYGLLIYQAAVHHGLDPFEAGAFILAEHRGRDFDPLLTGRHGKGGEAGLFQLVPVWAKEANKRCDPKIRKTKPRYAGKGDCLFIGPEDRVSYKLTDVRSPDRILYRLPDKTTEVVFTKKPKRHIAKAKKAGWKVLDHRAGEIVPSKMLKRLKRRQNRPKLANLDLFMSRVNIEAGVIAFARLKYEYAKKHKTYLPQWRLLFRCNPGSVIPLYRYVWEQKRKKSRRPIAPAGLGVMRRCEASGRRVLHWENDIRAHHEKVIEKGLRLIKDQEDGV